jgi:hypothetical protein
VAAWVAALIGIAGLVLTHPSASSWVAFRSYARMGPVREATPAIVPGELPADSELQLILELPLPTAAPVIEEAAPVFVQREPVTPQATAAPATATAAGAGVVAPLPPVENTPRALPEAPQAAQALTGGPTTPPRNTPSAEPTPVKAVGPLTPTRGGTGWVSPPGGSSSTARSR